MLDDAVTNDQSQPPVWNVGTPIALASLNAGRRASGTVGAAARQPRW